MHVRREALAWVERYINDPPPPLTDMRRPDEHRVCYVGKNTKKKYCTACTNHTHVRHDQHLSPFRRRGALRPKEPAPHSTAPHAVPIKVLSRVGRHACNFLRADPRHRPVELGEFLCISRSTSAVPVQNGQRPRWSERMGGVHAFFPISTHFFPFSVPVESILKERRAEGNDSNMFRTDGVHRKVFFFSEHKMVTKTDEY